MVDGSMLMFKLFCSSDFVMGLYYTRQGTCKSAGSGEEQVSSDRPGKQSAREESPVCSPLVRYAQCRRHDPRSDGALGVQAA